MAQTSGVCSSLLLHSGLWPAGLRDPSFQAPPALGLHLQSTQTVCDTFLHMIIGQPSPLRALGSMRAEIKGISSHYCACVRALSHVQLFLTPWTVAYRLLCPWDSLGKNTGVGCHFLLQGIFPIQGSNPHLLYLLPCGRILCRLSHQGNV